MYRISRLQQEYQDDDEGALQPPLPPSHHVPQGPLGLVDASASNTVSLMEVHHATAASSFADTNDRSVPPRTKTKQASLDDSTASLSFSGDELHVNNNNNTANIKTMTASSNHTSNAINSGHEFEASREFSLSMLPTDHSASNHTGGYHSSLASFSDELLHNDDHDNDMQGRASHKQQHQQHQPSTKTQQEEKVKQILAQRKLSASASTSGGYHSSGSNLHNSMSHSNSSSNISSYSHSHAMQDADDDDEPPALMQESLSSMPPLMTEEEEADADTETVAAVNMAPAPLVEVDRAAGRMSHDASFNKSSSRFSDSVARMSDTSGCSSTNRRRRSLSRTSKRSSKTVPLPPPPPPPVEPPPPHVLQQQHAHALLPMQDRSSRRRRPSRVKSVDGITNRFKTRQQQQQQPQVIKLQQGMEESSSNNSPMDFNMVDNAYYEEVEDEVAHITAAMGMDESATSVRSRRIMNDVSNNSTSVRRNKTGSAAAAVGKKEGRKPSRQIPPRSHTMDGRSTTTSSAMTMTTTVPQPTAAVATTAATKRRPKRNQSTSVMAASSSSLMMVDHLPTTTTTLSSAKNKLSASLRRTRTAEEQRATPSSQAAQAAAMMDSSTSTSTSTGSDGGGSGSGSGHSKQQQQQQQQRLRSSSKKPKRNRSFTAKLAAAAAAPMRRSLRRTRTIDERKDGATNINNTMDTSAATSRTRSHSLRRTKTIDERTFPRRTLSTGFGTATKAQQKPTSRKQQQKRHAAINRPATRLNIFGSDMVSTNYILGQLDLLANTSDIVHVELEDCLGRLDDGSHDIPLRLKQILQQDARPWETVVFTDELVDGFAYKDFKRRRKLFLRVLDGVCAHKVIPVQYKLKVSLKDMIEEEGDTNKNNDDNKDKDDDDNHHYNNNNSMDASCNTASSSFSQDDPTISSTGRCRPKGMDYMTHLIYEFQRDASIVDLTVTSNRATVELIHALIALLECDDRSWDNLALHLTSQGPPAAATLSQQDMIQWQNAMQSTTQKLQQVAQARGIVWPSH